MNLTYKAKRAWARVVDRPYNISDPTHHEEQLIEELRRSVSGIAVEDFVGSDHWKSVQRKLVSRIQNEDPREFLDWEEIVSTMFYIAPQQEFQEIRDSAHWRKLKPGLKENKVGKPPKYLHYFNTSGNLVHHAYSLLQLLKVSSGKVTEEIPRVLEFGGGYGSLCRLFYQVGFTGKYWIYDLELFNFLQRYFLKSVGLGPVALGQPKDNCKIQLINSQAYLAEKPLKLPDLLIGLWSLSETDPDFRQEFLDKIGKPGRILLSYQQEYYGWDNVSYFNQLKNEWTDYNWVDIPIGHLKNNHYLIGIHSDLK